MNCKQDVAQEDAKFFDGVFVCPVCNTMAERLFARSRQELNDLLVMLKEGIRIALIDGRLHFGEGSETEPSKKEVLEAIVKLQEMSDVRKAAALQVGSERDDVSGPGP